MRWDGECTLVKKEYVLDDEGVMQAYDVKTDVFCNVFTVGHNTWSSMYEIGISADAEIQVHTFEYDNQKDVVFEGKWYSVERVKREGDYTRLVLRHQQSDSPDEEDVYGSE